MVGRLLKNRNSVICFIEKQGCSLYYKRTDGKQCISDFLAVAVYMEISGNWAG